MKRRSNPPSSKTKGTYSKKRASGKMMYGPTSHKRTHRRISDQKDFDNDSFEIS